MSLIIIQWHCVYYLTQGWQATRINDLLRLRTASASVCFSMRLLYLGNKKEQKVYIRSRPPFPIYTAWCLLLQRQAQQATTSSQA